MNSSSPKILVVDNDPSTQQMVAQLLRSEKWESLFAPGTSDALNILSINQIDLLLVTDNIIGADSLYLISQVRQLHPDVIRIYFSGNKDSIDTVSILAEGLVQQIIPKPWVDLELIEIIRSALRQRALQKSHSPEFQALINSIPLLPSLPESYSNVRSCIIGDEVNIDKLTEYISQDVAISTALLHWANSALFGQRFQVDTIKKAVIVLGTNIVENLILSESINRTIAGELPEIKGFDFNKFKKHSMATAILSRLLIKSYRPTDFIEHDRAFVAGLLHDLGKLAAASFFPKRFEQALELAKRDHSCLYDAEMQIYKTHHAELGGFLAEWWALPPFVVNATAWHHQPQSTPFNQDIIAATHVANLLSYQFGYGSSSNTCTREIDEDYTKMFYLTDEANEILKNETDQTLQALIR